MEWRGSEAWESSGQIFLCFKFAKQKFFLTRNLVCFNFLEMLIFTLSSFVYFCLVCFFEGEGWFRGWIEGIYMLAHLLCINFFHRTIWIFKDPSFSPPPSPHPLPLPLPATHTHTPTHTHIRTHTHAHTLLQLRLRPVCSHNLRWPLKPRHYKILKSQHRSWYFHLHVHLLVHCWYEVETILSSANVQSVERCSEKTWGEFTLQSLSLSLPQSQQIVLVKK